MSVPWQHSAAEGVAYKGPKCLSIRASGAILALLVGIAGSGGCAWKGEGLIEEGALGPMLQTSTGQRMKLVVGEEDRILGHLGGHMVTLEGQRVGRTLRVAEWHIPAGLHGMNVWFGNLERRGVQLGMQDRNSGAYYFFDPASEPVLGPHVGQPVLVEGYVAGAHVVKVLHVELLTDEPSERSGGQQPQ